MRVLITGVSGFVGSYLATALTSIANVELYGIVRHPARLAPDIASRLTLFQGDLVDTGFVFNLLEQVKPAMIYHLAGQASEPQSWADPWQTYQTNLLSQLNLFQGLLQGGFESRFLSITSGKVYGEVAAAAMPITENAPLQPNSPYSVSKAAQDLMARQYFVSHQMPIIRVRPFNHIGPGQSAEFVTASFARQIALVEAGLHEPVIRVGNLNVSRDFTDVRDVVRAYLLLMEAGELGEAYNIGFGQAISIQNVLDILLGFSSVKIRVEVDPARLRPADYPISYGSIEKISEATGWQPEISIQASLLDILNYWREQVVIDHT